MVAWLVLIVSTLILLGFLVYLIIDDWKTALIALMGSVLLTASAVGVAWSLVELFG